MRRILPFALTVACAACGFDDWAADRFDEPVDESDPSADGPPAPAPRLDAAPRRDATTTRRDAAAPRSDADEVRGDAAPPDLRPDAGPPPAHQEAGAPSPPPPRIRLTVAAAPEAGCGERTLSLTWTTQRATRCAFGAPPDVPLRDVAADYVVRGGAVLVLQADATVELSCDGPGGRTSEGAPVVFAPSLPPERTLLRDGASLRATQQRCAAATGGPAMTQDDQVRDDQASAARLCACLGYATATVERTDAQCFTSPHDNGIWWWEAASTTWASAGASHQDGCLKVVQCTQPVAACADLIIVD